MKLLVGDKGNVDFECPIQATQEQINQLNDFLKFDLGYLIEIELIDEFRTQRLGEKHFQSKWSRDELYYLFSLDDTWTIAKKLGRSWLSIDMKRSLYYRDFKNFALKNKLSLIGKKNIMKAIDKYIEQNDKLKEDRKQIRQRRNKLPDEIEGIELDIELLKSSQHKAKTKTLIEFGAIKTDFNSEIDDIDKYVGNYIKKQIELKEKKLKELKEELNELGE